MAPSKEARASHQFAGSDLCQQGVFSLARVSVREVKGSKRTSAASKKLLPLE
jgi:hypothetical protein